jgi:hypothetical protein
MATTRQWERWAEEIRATIRTTPQQCRLLLRGLYRRVGALQRDLADRLGVDPGTLSRWLLRLGLREEFAEMTRRAKAEGWVAEDRRGKRGPDRAPRKSRAGHHKRSRARSKARRPHGSGT